jgi:hypothetical protein
MNYHNRIFKAVSNSENGLVSTSMLFYYQQEGNILTCSYSGPKILKGQLLGIVDENGNIDMRYHQINQDGELQTGICLSRPEMLEDGRIRLYEQWRWTSGDQSEGASILEEVRDFLS